MINKKCVMCKKDGISKDYKTSETLCKYCSYVNQLIYNEKKNGV